MKRSFVLYCDLDEHLSLLTMEQRGVLLTAIMSYQNGKDVPEMDNTTAVLFSVIKAQFKRDDEKYNETAEKRRAAGRMGGAPRGNQNAKKQPQNNPPAKKQAKQPKQANACNGANAGNISDCGGGQGVEKQPKQAKQPDNDTVNDTDIKEISTSVLTKKRTDGRSDKEAICKKAQAEFFALYPEIGMNFSPCSINIFFSSFCFLREYSLPSARYSRINGIPTNINSNNITKGIVHHIFSP